MNVAYAIGRLEAAGFTHEQATGVVEVMHGEISEILASRDRVGESTGLRLREPAERIGAVRREHASRIGLTKAELEQAIDRQICWMVGLLVAILVAVLGFGGAVISKL